MALTVGIGLLAARLTLRGLGEVDAEIWFKLVAAVGVAFVLYEGVSVAAERAIAFEIGRSAGNAVAEVFSTVAAIFGAMGLLVAVLGLALKDWVPLWVVVAPERLEAASAGVPFLAGMIAVQILAAPFRVMFVSNQTMGVLTVSDLADSVGKLLAIVFAVRLAGEGEGGALVLLCQFSFAAQCVSSLMVVLMCMWFYPAGRPRVSMFSRRALGELAHFTSWSVVGNISYRLRMSGPPILLARMFSERSPVNTAYALGANVAGYQLSLSGAISRAAGPAVISAWGRGDRARVLELVQLVNKYSTILALFYLIPLELEMPAVLVVWLGEGHIPEYAAPFIRLVMVQMAVPWLYMGYHHAISAHGQIARYMLIAVGMEVLSLIAAAFTLRIAGVAPWMVCVTLTAMTVLTCSVYVVHISRLLEMPFSRWLTGTWWPVAAVAIPSTVVASLPGFVMEEGLVRIVVTTVAFAVAAVPLTWVVAMSPEERGHFTRLAGAVRARFGGSGGSGP